MPIDSILVSAGVVAMFVAFAGVLMWGNHQTRPTQPGLPAGTAKRRSI
jgi:hypothetical protein